MDIANPQNALGNYQDDVAAVGRIDIVPTILSTVCRATGLGFAAVARVTDERWIACSVRDEINFGLQAGGELKVETTICHEIRQSGKAVIISDVHKDVIFRDHHTPAMYGFRSYVSVPIVLSDGRFFGTLCAIDPAPKDLENPDTLKMFELFAHLLGSHLEIADQLAAAATTILQQDTERDLLWESSPDLLAEMDFEGRLLRVNPACLSLLGYQPEELIGHLVSSLVFPEDSMKTQEAIAEAAQGGSPTVENRYRHKDGSTRWFSWVAASTQRIILTTGRHITAQREAEAALRDEQDFARLALAAVGGVGVWTYDIPADRFFCDAAISALYALDPERGAAGFLREEFFANVHPEDREPLRKVLAGGLQREGELELEYRLLHPDGSIHCVLSRGHTYLDADGQPVRRTGIGVDMTSQRQVEDQLRQSQKMEALGQLTGGIAHDFNNLLTVIRGSSELLRRPDLAPDKRQRYADAIADTADRAIKLTSQLLAFARRQALTPEVFDAGASIKAIADMVGTLAGSGVAITVDVDHCPCIVNADRTQFDTALINMVVNARDAMNGEGRLTITARPAPSIPAATAHGAVAGEFLAVTLTDTGPGIPPDKLDRIFDPFFTTKGVGKGTGLGLSQVFGFAKQSGGDVLASNPEGGGASFTLYLPLAAQQQAAPSAASAKENVATSGEGLHILVVEDNVDVGEFATQALAELGFKTRWVVSGREALAELALARDFDLVFSDVVMPGMSGIELGREVQRLYPDLPVVLTSGYSEAIVQSGASGFPLLHKPYSIASLSRILLASNVPTG